MSDAVRIIQLGTGTPEPKRDRAGSSTLVMVGERALIVDLGPGAAVNLYEAGIDPTSIVQVFLTHHHFDHIADLGHFVLTRWDQGAGRGNELDVYGPAGTRRIASLLFDDDGVYGPDLEARSEHPLSREVYRERGGWLPRLKPTIRAHDLEVGDTVAGDAWTVRTGRAMHGQPILRMLAYRIDAPGGSVAISGDTCYLREMAELARGAHTLIHMAMDLESGRARAPLTFDYTSTALDAGKVAREAGVRRLVLVHARTMFHDPIALDDLVAEAQTVFDGEVIAGEDRLELAVGPD